MGGMPPWSLGSRPLRQPLLFLPFFFAAGKGPKRPFFALFFALLLLCFALFFLPPCLPARKGKNGSRFFSFFSRVFFAAEQKMYFLGFHLFLGFRAVVLGMRASSSVLDYGSPKPFKPFSLCFCFGGVWRLPGLVSYEKKNRFASAGRSWWARAGAFLRVSALFFGFSKLTKTHENSRKPP